MAEYDKRLIKLGEFILNYRIPIFVIVLVVTVLLGYQLRNYSIAQNLRDDLPEDNPEIVYFEEFNDQFGDQELLLFLVGTQDGIFTEDHLRFLDHLTGEMEKVEGIDEVVSLTNVSEILGREGGIEVEHFIGEVPSDPQELAKLKEKALADPSWVGSLISADGKVASINGKLKVLAEDATYRFRVVEQIRRILEENHRPDLILHATGVATLFSDSEMAIDHDLKNFMWLTPVMIMVLLFLVFRNLRGIFIPITIIITATVWVMGLFFYTGRSVTMITTMLPTLMGVIALSDIIHMITKYYEELANGAAKRESIVNTVAAMTGPCFLTSSTTAVGFGSLITSEVVEVKAFGMFSFCGIFFAFFLATLLVPIFLSFLPVPKRNLKARLEGGVLSKILRGIEIVVEKDRYIVLPMCLVIAVVAVIGIKMLKVETQISKFIPDHSPSRVGLEYAMEHLAGVTQLEMTLRGKPGDFKDPESLREMEKLVAFVGNLEGVDKVHSMLEFIKTLNKVMNEGRQEFYEIPESRELVAQYLFLLSLTGREDLLDAFVNYDYSYTRVSARIESMSNQGHLRLLKAVDEFAKREMDPRFEFRTTGAVKLYSTITDALVRGQIRTLFLAFAVITLMLIIHLRSFKIGSVSMLPNVLPILITLGFMGLTGYTLNVATVMISCIALGIAVDDTIHYLSRYRRELDADGEIVPAMRRTISSTGRAIVYTSIVIAGGFLIMVFSSFMPNRAFGTFTAITMLSALFADLLVLPVLVKVLKLGR